MRSLLIGLSFWFLPQAVAASVEITEIAWMGSAASANHEWIELYNSGSSVDLGGWILHDANNLTIELTGTLESGQYAVLERTSDASAPGDAFLLYTGALSNVGATLVLRDAVGAVVDQVSGGMDWDTVGGNNQTKDTAQKTDASWQTAPPTPGSATVLAAVETVVTESATTDTPSSSGVVVTQGASATQKKLVLPDITLQLAIAAQNTAHVGQPVAFEVAPSGVGPTIADSLTYMWNIGNGIELEGKEVSYTFEHPGEYVVVVSGAYKRQEQFQRHVVSVLPASLTLSRVDSLYAVHNTDDSEIDIGGYTLAGTDSYMFPEHTIILPGSRVVIPKRVDDSFGSFVVLYDQIKNAVASHVPVYLQPHTTITQTQPATPSPLAVAVVSSPVVVQESAPSQRFGFVSEDTPQVVELPAPVAQEELQPLPAAMNQTKSTQGQWPIVALVVLLFVSTLGIYLVPKKSDSPPWV